MIRTDIVLTDDFTGEKATFTAKNKAELLKVMEQNKIDKCNVDFTFAGMSGLTTTIYRDQLAEELQDQQKG
jgi:hypothetical protein